MINILMFLQISVRMAIVIACPSRPPITTPTKSTQTTSLPPRDQCLKDSDCQDNAGCFLIEPLELDPITFEPKTTCHCLLGYLLDNSTVNLPKTGFCQHLRTIPCTGDTSKDYCIHNIEGWGLCPYCRVKAFLE